MFLVSSCSWIHWSQVLSQEWRWDVVGAAPTGDAATTSEWSTIPLPTKVCLILEVWRYATTMYGHFFFRFLCDVLTGNLMVTWYVVLFVLFVYNSEGWIKQYKNPVDRPCTHLILHWLLRLRWGMGLYYLSTIIYAIRYLDFRSREISKSRD